MKLVYCAILTLRYNGELMLNDVETVCTTEELSKREVDKSANHLKKIKDDLGYGKCVWEYFYCDGAGVYHLILQYQDNGTLACTWRIHGTELIES